MKKLLSLAAAGLLTSALLDPVIQSGLGNQIPWGSDIAMAAGGIACLYVLVKFRDNL